MKIAENTFGVPCGCGVLYFCVYSGKVTEERKCTNNDGYYGGEKTHKRIASVFGLFCGENSRQRSLQNTEERTLEIHNEYCRFGHMSKVEITNFTTYPNSIDGHCLEVLAAACEHRFEFFVSCEVR